ncbi:MAG: glycosyltransferase [Candidatus Zhuqueibacterota bacterium]
MPSATHEILKGKKILYIHRDGQGWGGAQQGVIDLIENFKKEFGATVFVGNKGLLLQRSRQANVTCYELPFHRVMLFPISFLLLAAVLIKEKPDLVHSNHRFTSILVQFARKLIRGKFQTLHTARSVFHDKMFVRDVGDRVVAISESVKRNMVEQFAFPAEKIDVIYNGIELSKNGASLPDNEKLAQIDVDSKIVFGIIGGLVESKGHTFLFQALSTLPERLKKQIVVLVAGEGYLAKELDLLVRRYQLSDSVVFLGHCRDIHRVLARCRFLVIPSIQEGGSRVLIEGYLTGIPSIAFGLLFAYEFIEHQKTGFIVPVRDVAALASAIQFYTEHPHIVSEHGHNGKLFATGKFTRQRMVDQYRFIYEAMLDEPPPR